MQEGEIIKIENIQVKKGDLIGKGTFGFVYKAEQKDGSIVALKQQMISTDHEKTILQIIKGKKYDHLIQVFAAEEKGNGIFILMELGNQINLKNQPNKRLICLQMAKSVQELHKLEFFHRDLKPENFVIGNDNKIKLIDFGIAKTITKEAQTKGKGTKAYIAPEVYITPEYDSSVDIWSLGLIFYEIFTNDSFFDKNLTDYQTMKQSVEISQFQINSILTKQERNKKINKQQKELLQKMIVQRLDNQQNLVTSIIRLSIDKVINELEKLNILEQTQQQFQKQKN